MKNRFKFTLILSLAMLFSCSEDYLNRSPYDKISKLNFDPDLALMGTYNILRRNEISQEMHAFDACTPINYTRFRQWNKFPKGTATSDGGRSGRLWEDLYKGIFRANDFLISLEAHEGMSPADKIIYEAEARFLRGYFYHRLFSSFGRCILTLEPLTIENARQQVRASETDILDAIFADLDFAEENLSETARLSGGATKGAAMALKARVHLYEGNWQGVIDETQKVINLGVYDLYEDEFPEDNFAKIFHHENELNKEVIFDVAFSGGHFDDGNAFQTYINGKAHEMNPGFVRSNPTMYLVSKFENRDGTPVTDPKDVSNRDYRFYASILYPGATFNGVVDPPGMLRQSQTGMNQRKYTMEFDEMFLTMRRGINNFILLRYADILLMYAEAQNELVGPDASVYAAVNRLRSRGGILDLPAGLSKAEMRERIHNERIVELAFEGLALWDMRRWGKAGTIEGSMDAITYMATYSPVGWDGQTPADYVFAEKDYLWPIPLNSIDNIPTLEGDQNPGW